MKKLSQREVVKQKLLADGEASRNWALSQYPSITRLASIIGLLKAEGYEIEPKDEGRDYVYRLQAMPKKIVSKVVEREGKFYEIKVAVAA